jgi:hypothetical protein
MRQPCLPFLLSLLALLANGVLTSSFEDDEISLEQRASFALSQSGFYDSNSQRCWGYDFTTVIFGTVTNMVIYGSGFVSGRTRIVIGTSESFATCRHV